MTRYFTQYWQNRSWDLLRSGNQQGDHLDHTAGSHFRDCGVTAGDMVYVVTIRGGNLFLLARGKVDRITDRRTAARHLDTRPEYLWDASDHLLFAKDEASRQRFDRMVPPATARALRVVRADGPRPLKFVSDTRLDQQTLRGTCELTAESARLLDGVLGDKTVIATGRPRPAASKVPEALRPATAVRYRREREFEHACVEPLLRRLDFTFEAQYKSHWKRGSRYFEYIVDHLVLSDAKPITLVENKLNIASRKALDEAVKQARSYAMELALPSFVVAAQEGLWLYRLWNGREDRVHPHVLWPEIGYHEARLKSLMLWLHEVAWGGPPPLPEHDVNASARTLGETNPAWPPPPADMPIHLPDAKPYVDAMALDRVQQAGRLAQDDLVRQVRDQWGLKRAGRRVTVAVNGSVARLIRRHAIHREPGKDRVLVLGSGGR